MNSYRSITAKMLAIIVATLLAIQSFASPSPNQLPASSPSDLLRYETGWSFGDDAKAVASYELVQTQLAGFGAPRLSFGPALGTDLVSKSTLTGFSGAIVWEQKIKNSKLRPYAGLAGYLLTGPSRKFYGSGSFVIGVRLEID